MKLPLSLLLSVYLLLAVWVHASWPTPPPAKTADAAVSEFSAMRALRHVEAIAQTPHPVGSEAHRLVRDHLITTLRAMGLRVETQPTLAMNRYLPIGIGASFAQVENIVATLPGRLPGRSDDDALLLMAHYDSERTTPGASDDSAGVATILETVRALSAEPRRARDLIVLLSDGEELGLLGAQAFFDHHPLATRVGMVLNFEARGSSGPAYMFQVSPDGGALIDTLRQHVPAANSNSLLQSIYKVMPNNTDLSIALDARRPGMNFAFAKGQFDYHAPTDTVEHLDPASLQHMGDYALPLARHFLAAGPPPSATAGSYFVLPGAGLVHYPFWVDIAALVVSLLLIATAYRRWRRAGALCWGGVARGAGVATLALLASAMMPSVLHQAVARHLGGGMTLETMWTLLAQGSAWYGAWSLMAMGVTLWIVGRTRTGLSWRLALAASVGLLALLPLLWGGSLLLSFIAAPVLALLLALLLRRPLPASAFIAGALIVQLIIASAIALLLSGALPIFVWPLLAVAVAAVLSPSADTPSAVAIWLLAMLPAAFLLGGTSYQLNLAVGAVIPAAATVPLVLALLLCAPLALKGRTDHVGAAFVAIAVLWTTFLGLRDPFDTRHPRPTSLFVLQDVDARSSAWASIDYTPTDWHQRVLGASPTIVEAPNYFPDYQARTLLTRNTLPLVAPPELTYVSTKRIEGMRRIALRLRPGACADETYLYVPPGASLRGWQVEGRPFDPATLSPAAWSSLSGYALPAEGVDIALDFVPGKPLPELIVTAVCHALPPGASLPPRPAGQMARPHANSGDTVVTRRIALSRLASAAAGAE